MRRRVVGAAATAVGVLVLAACSSEAAEPATTPPSPATVPAAATVPPTDPPTTVAATTTTTTAPVTTTTPPSTVVETTTTVAAPTTVGETTTTTAAPAVCSLVIAPGESLSFIVDRLGDPAVTVDAVALENGITDPNSIDAGSALDVCPGNAVDDVTGAPRVPTTAPPALPTGAVPAPPPVAAATASGVPAQQQKLNELFGPYGMRLLDVDGRSGRLTRQLLCAARLALGLPISRDDMAPGSAEEQALMAATGLPIPPGAPVGAERWGLIDQHCQVLFVGQGGNGLVFVFPTSTGQADFPTRDQDASRVFRFNPARDNGGWHNSIDYPAGDDNPLNGNMYKPLYFDRGQAIHGANTVPTSPASHGCARLRVTDQDALVSWLGLADQGSQIWDGASRINFTVSVVGRY